MMNVNGDYSRELSNERNGKEIDVLVSTLAKHLDDLDSRLKSLNEHPNNISLNQGTISEDGFIEKTLRSIWEIIKDGSKPSYPQFNLNNIEKSYSEDQITNKMILELCGIIKEFKNLVNSARNTKKIADDFTTFKTEIKKSWIDFKIELN